MRRLRIPRVVFVASLVSGLTVILAALAVASGGWVSQTAPSGSDVHDLEFQSALTGFAVGRDGIIATVDGGDTWTIRTAGTGVSLNGIHFPAGSTAGYAVGDSGTILKTIDGGVNWLVQPTPVADHLYGVDFPVGGTIGYAVGNQGLILKTIDGGANWTVQTPPTSNELTAVSFPADALIGYAVGRNQTILKTTDGGANWVLQTSPVNRHLLDVRFPVDADTGFAVGQSGLILITTDGGTNWVAQTTPTTEDLYGVDFPASASFGYAVGANGMILATVDGGVNWVIELPPDNDDLIAVDFTTGFGQGWAVGKNGTIIKRAGGSPPELAFIEDQAINEMEPFALTATATDADGASADLLFTLEGTPPPGANLTSDGNFTWTPTEIQGPATYPITVRVTDSTGFWDEQTFSIQVDEVNVDVVADAVADVVTDELVAISLVATATDPDLPANSLIWSLVSGPPGAAVSPSGVFSWTPSEVDGPGWFPVTLSVTDGKSSSEVTFRVTVEEVNVAPVPVAVGDVVTDELVALSFGVSASDADVPVQVLSWSMVSGPLGAAVSAGGVFSWTPSEVDGPGSFPVTVAVSDGVESSDLMFVVTVNEVNVAPVPVAVGDVVTDELVALSFGVSASDADVPVQVMSWSMVSGPPGAAVSAGGAFTWTPSEEDGPGIHEVTLRVSDGTASSSLSFDIVVKEVNLPPLPGRVPTQTVRGLSPIEFEVTAVDVDYPGNELTWTRMSGPTWVDVSSHGVVVITPPDVGGVETYDVTLSVSDGLASSDVTFLVVVEPAITPVIPDTPVETEDIVGAVASSARKDDVVAAVGSFVEAPQVEGDESVVRTLVIMGGVTAAAVQTLGMPFVFLILLGLMVATLGNISVFPMMGRTRRMTGTVIEYDTEDGFGFVLEDENGLKVFLSGDMLRRKFGRPNAGERISFRMLKGSTRDFALDVRRLEA